MKGKLHNWRYEQVKDLNETEHDQYDGCGLTRVAVFLDPVVTSEQPHLTTINFTIYENLAL